MDDDDMPALPADALQALKEFYNERDSRQKKFEELQSQAEDDFDGPKQWSMESFAEDWNASQFWYTDETATILAKELLIDATNDSNIVVVSAPSVFIQLKNLLSSNEYDIRPSIMLLEYDNRFAVFKDQFTFYDFENPTRLPGKLKGKFDRIICDPPFLSNDCQTKAALTVRWLAKSWNASGSDTGALNDHLRLLVCTGERMEDLVTKLYGKAGLKTTDFEIKHSKGLSNEFRCYANFEDEHWSWSP